MRVLALAAAVMLISAAQAETVCSVHDGDTFTTCSGVHVRVSGIDAPELKQPFGIDSRDYLTSITANREIQTTCNSQSFNRQVCTVKVFSSKQKTFDLGAAMVGSGYAYDSLKYSHGFYAADESFARDGGLGVWSQEDGGIRPWDFRHNQRRAHK